MHTHLNAGNLDYYTDLYWSGVGPQHERVSYNLLYLFDVYKVHGCSSFEACHAYGFKAGAMPKKQCATMPAAKRAARSLFIQWLANTGGSIEWQVANTCVHFEATADGLKLGHYYHCPEPKGNWHIGFRAHFGMTYYDERRVTTPDQAKVAISETWAEWLGRARKRFLVESAAA